MCCCMVQSVEPHLINTCGSRTPSDIDASTPYWAFPTYNSGPGTLQHLKIDRGGRPRNSNWQSSQAPHGMAWSSCSYTKLTYTQTNLVWMATSDSSTVWTPEKVERCCMQGPEWGWLVWSDHMWDNMVSNLPPWHSQLPASTGWHLGITSWPGGVSAVLKEVQKRKW